MIRTYIPLSGNLSHTVDGPNGTWLVTPRQRQGLDLFDVWKSDSLRTASSPGNLAAALRMACTKTGCAATEVATFLETQGCAK